MRPGPSSKPLQVAYRRKVFEASSAPSKRTWAQSAPRIEVSAEASKDAEYVPPWILGRRRALMLETVDLATLWTVSRMCAK